MYKSIGTAFIRSQNIHDNRFNRNGLVFIDEDAANSLQSVAVEPGDVLLNITGDSVARCCVVPESVLPARVSQHVMIIRPNRLKLDSKYLQLSLTSPNVKQHLLALASGGATRPALTKDHIANLVLELPSIGGQQAISSVLGAFDDEIAENQQAIERCFDMSVALYRRSLLSGSRSVSVGSIAQFHNRQRIPLSARERAARQGPYPYHGAAGVLDRVDGFLFDGVHVLVGEDGTVVVDDSHPMIQYVWGKFWVSNHAHVLTGNLVSTELLRCALALADVSAAITGAVQPKLSMGNLKAVEIQIPERLDKIEEQLGWLGCLERALAADGKSLSALRDALLPGLLSGGLHVRGESSLVEAEG